MNRSLLLKEDEMNKTRYYPTTIVLIFSLIFQLVLATPKIVKAEPLIQFEFLTGVTLSDENGNPFSGSISPDSALTIRYDYAIPDELEPDTAIIYQVTRIPEEIKILEPIAIPLKQMREVEGVFTEVLVGTVFISVTGEVTLKFEETVNDPDYLYDRTGHFFVYSRFDEEKVQGTEEIVFDLGNGDSVTVEVIFEEEVITHNLDLQKSGQFNAASNEITWKINVRPSSLPLMVPMENVVITDTLEEGQTFVPDSFTITPMAEGAFSMVDGRLSFQFADDINKTSGESYEISFKTKIDTTVFTKEDQTVIYKNHALGTFNKEGTAKSNTAEVPVKADFIKKTGSYNAGTKSIQWTVDVNNNLFTLADFNVFDFIPAGLELKRDSVKLNGTSVAISSEGPLTYDESTRKLNYHFMEPVTTKQTLTFTTAVTDESVYLKNTATTFSNTAYISGQGIPEGSSAATGVGVTSSLIEKYSDGYNRSTGEISWRVVINKNQVGLTDAGFEDQILMGQEYVPGSFTVDGIAPAPERFSYMEALDGDTLKTGTLSYAFGDISRQYVIRFKTRVTDSDVYAGNVSNRPYRNTGYLSADNIAKVSATATTNVSSQVIQKSGAAYDFTTREITWTVTVNQNQMRLSNTYFIDQINEKVEFVDGSLQVDGIFLEKGTTPEQKNAYTYDEDTRTLRVNFPELISTRKVVTFKTKITDLSVFESNGDKNISNTAVFYGDGFKPVSHTATRTVKSAVIDKTGRYENGTDFIEWDVVVNKNELSIPSPVLRDQLPVGLKLNLASVKLFSIDIASDGTYTIGAEVPVGLENLVYDPDTNLFEFKFLKNIQEAYLLRFSTDIAETHRNQTFRNSISFKGILNNETSTSNSISVSFQAGGGAASGSTRGSLTVIKSDADQGATRLEGTVFHLFDRFGIKVAEGTTDSSGKVIFRGLLLNSLYTLKEITPSEGYLLDGTPLEFILTGATESRNITREIKNEIIRGDIKIRKTGENHEPLAGVVFELYTLVNGQTGELVETMATDENGIAVFHDVPYGKYRVIEKETIEGYRLSKTPQDFNILKDQEVLEGTFINEVIRGNLTIEKIGEDKELLAGAIFGVFAETADISKDEPLWQGTTGEDGQVTFNDIPYGKYLVAELEAPEGHRKSEEVHPVSITEDGKTVMMTLDNEKIRGSLLLTKKSTDGVLLSGAEFTLYHIADGERISAGTKVTSSDGTLEFQDLVFGAYEVEETKAPEGYNLSEEVYSFNIENHEEVITKTFLNKKIRGHVQVVKVSAGEESTPLAGAEFGLYAKGDEDLENPLALVKTGADGTATFEEIEYGDYIIVETMAPEGYLLSEEPQTVSIINQDETIELTFRNEQIMGSLRLMKSDASGNPLTGAKFMLTRLTEVETEEEPMVGTSDENGIVLFENLPYGHYTLIESEAPEGYLLADEGITVEIKEHGKTVEISVVNERILGSLKVIKKDAEGSVLQGAEFTLYPAAEFNTPGKGMVKVTDETGETIFENLPYGKYIVVESNAPEGYQLNAEPVEIEILEHGVVLEETFVNEQITGNLLILKTDENGKALAGSVFQLYKVTDKENVLVATVTSGENGSAVVEDLPYGEYLLIEAEAPKGYVKIDEPMKVSIKTMGEIVKVTVVNEMIEEESVLPSAGETSSALFMGMGILMILMAVALLGKGRKRI